MSSLTFPEQDILGLLRFQAWAPTQLAEELEQPVSLVARVLEGLREKSLVQRLGQGTWVRCGGPALSLEGESIVIRV